MGWSLAPLLNGTAEPAIVSHWPMGRPIAEPAVLLNRSEHIWVLSIPKKKQGRWNRADFQFADDDYLNGSQGCSAALLGKCDLILTLLLPLKGGWRNPNPADFQFASKRYPRPFNRAPRSGWSSGVASTASFAIEMVLSKSRRCPVRSYSKFSL